MPTHTFQVDIIWLTCEDDLLIARAVLFPELSALGDDKGVVRRQLLRNIRRVLESLDPGQVYCRQPAGAPELREASIAISPSVSSSPQSTRSAWESPVETRFHYVVWDHGETLRLALVPLLDLQIICSPIEDLSTLIEHEIRFALQRMPEPTTLETLCHLQRVRRAKLERTSFHAEVKTLKQHLGQSEQANQKRELEKVATNLDAYQHSPVFEREELVGKLAECLTGTNPRSVLLVGPSGGGKTALIHELFRRRIDFELASRPFWSTSGARMVAGMSGYGMWEERCQQICREAAGDKAIVHVGHLMELLHVGKSAGSDQGIGDFLAPSLERGELLGIAECTVEQLSIIERESPRVMRAFFRLDVPEPSSAATCRIIRRNAEHLTEGRDIVLSDDGAETVERLHRRYATYSASPGRPLRFLRNLLDNAGIHGHLDSSDVTRRFMLETGLPIHLLEDSERLDLAATRDWLTRRVMGQSDAVDVVVSLLAGIKAGLTRPARPIASLLFIGPTGVGKTEMAKSLAEYLYRDSQRMARIDMSEYSEASSVVRLAEGVSGAEGVLTSKVREQPFGVVLLDEFEKAHPAVFDLLLQVLGEGRLTDGRGRLADFRNSVIIMTSNLGSESYGRETVGFDSRQQEASFAEEHFLRAVQEFVRPEFFNRIDRVVPFLPLSQTALSRIARREIERLGFREGILCRDIELKWTEDVVQQILRLGYDVRYGARPLKRTIDQRLVAPLAEALNNRALSPRLVGTIDSGAKGFRVNVKAAAKAVNPVASQPDSARSDASLVVTLRRDVFRLRDSSGLSEIRTEIFRGVRAVARAAKRARRRAIRGYDDTLIVEEIKRKLVPAQAIVSQVTQLAEDAARLEDSVLSRYYGTLEEANARSTVDIGEMRRRLDTLCLDVYAHLMPDSDEITVVLYKDMNDVKDSAMIRLAEVYRAFAIECGHTVRTFTLSLCSDVEPPAKNRFVLAEQKSDSSVTEGTARHATPRHVRDDRMEAEVENDPLQCFRDPRKGTIGVALELAGRLAKPMFAREGGLHVFEEKGSEQYCLVHISSRPLREYSPPKGVLMSVRPGDHSIRRVYSAGRGVIEDKAMQRKEFWKGKGMAEVVGRIVRDRLSVEIRGRVDEG